LFSPKEKKEKVVFWGQTTGVAPKAWERKKSKQLAGWQARKPYCLERKKLGRKRRKKDASWQGPGKVPPGVPLIAFPPLSCQRLARAWERLTSRLTNFAPALPLPVRRKLSAFSVLALFFSSCNPKNRLLNSLWVSTSAPDGFAVWPAGVCPCQRLASWLAVACDAWRWLVSPSPIKTWKSNFKSGLLLSFFHPWETEHFLGWAFFFAVERLVTSGLNFLFFISFYQFLVLTLVFLLQGKQN
jgi:hypothetical protein